MSPRLKILVAAITSLLISYAASAQSVQQGGTVTPGHLPYWVTAGVIGDGGTAADSPITSIGATGQVCSNSARTSTGAWVSVCIQANTTSPGTVSIQNYGSASAQNLNFVINGTTSTPAFVTGSLIPGDLVSFQSGQVMQDSGIAASNGIITGGTWQGAPVGTNFGGTGASSAASARSNLGLGTMSTQNAGAVAITGGTITGLPTPLLATDAAIKSYVDGVASGLNVLPQSALATAAVLPNGPTYANGTLGVGATLTAGSNTTLTVDGTAATLNTVVLVKNQASAFQNGIYTVTAAGSGSAPWVLTRATYFNTAAQMKVGSYTFITSGTTQINTSWTLSSTVNTVGTDALNFNLFTSTGGGVTSVGGQVGAITCGNGISCGGNAITSAGLPYINPTQTPYTAQCNGSTDDTTALQTAINAAVAAGVAFYVPGICSFSGTLTISNSLTVFGDGTPGSILQGQSNTQQMISVTSQNAVVFRDLTIQTAGGTATAGYGIIVNPIGATQNNYSRFQNVVFGNTFIGIDFEKAAYWVIDNCQFNINPSTTGIVVRNTTTPDSGDSMISNTGFYAGGTLETGIAYQSSGGLKIKNSKFIGGQNGIVVSPQASSGIFNVVGSSFEGHASSAISITGTTSINFNEFQIVGNQFDGAWNTAGIYWNQGVGSSVAFGVISGNTFWRTGGASDVITLGSTSDIDVVGNTIHGSGSGNGINISSSCANCTASSNIVDGLATSISSTSSPVLETVVGATPRIAFHPGGVNHSIVVSSGVNNPNAAMLAAANDVYNTNIPMELRATSLAIPAFSCGGLATNSSGVVGCTSDGRLKDILGPFSYGLEAIMKIKPQEFSWKKDSYLYDGGTRNFGFVAQNVQKAMPETVSANPDGNLQVSQMAITAALVNSIHTLEARIKTLEARRRH